MRKLGKVEGGGGRGSDELFCFGGGRAYLARYSLISATCLQGMGVGGCDGGVALGPHKSEE